jgi:tetratricopeptide (TPR) repeat protein
MCVSVVLLASDCSQAHVRSMEENNAGVDFYQKKLYPRAVEHLNRAITLEESNEQAHFNLAQVYIQTEQWQDAARHLQRAIALNGGVADYHYKLGYVLFQLNEFEQSQTALVRAIELDPTLYRAYYRLGLVYQQLDRSEDALRQLTESINRNPRFFEAYRDLGTLYAELEFLPQAIQVFQSALEAVAEGSAEEAEIRHRLGTVYQEQRRFQDAVREFRRALEIDPLANDTLFSLGWTYALLDQREDARLYLKKFVNAGKGNGHVRDDFVKAAQDKLYEYGEDPFR